MIAIHVMSLRCVERGRNPFGWPYDVTLVTNNVSRKGPYELDDGEQVELNVFNFGINPGTPNTHWDYRLEWDSESFGDQQEINVWRAEYEDLSDFLTVDRTLDFNEDGLYTLTYRFKEII